MGSDKQKAASDFPGSDSYLSARLARSLATDDNGLCIRVSKFPGYSEGCSQDLDAKVKTADTFPSNSEPTIWKQVRNEIQVRQAIDVG